MIAVIYNVLGAEVGAYTRDEWSEACAIVDDSDRVAIFERDEKIEILTGAEFARLYKD